MQERQRCHRIRRLKCSGQDGPSPVPIPSLERSHPIGFQQSVSNHSPHVTAHRGKATTRAGRGAPAGLLDQPVEKSLLAQDQLAARRLVVGLAEAGQKSPNGRPVKPVVGSLRATQANEMSNLELFGLAPIHAAGVRDVVHSKSSASPKATSRN